MLVRVRHWNRHVAARTRPTERTGLVLAPAVGRAAERDAAAMKGALAHRLEHETTEDGYRCLRGTRRAVSKLPAIATAPAVRGGAGRDTTAVLETGAHGVESQSGGDRAWGFGAGTAEGRSPAIHEPVVNETA